MNDSIIISLISGLIGAIIGGALSFWGSWYGARLQVKSAKEMQENQEKVLFGRKVTSLLAEVMDNLDRADQLNVEGYHVWIKYSRDTWDEVKGDLFELPERVLLNLIKTYTEIARYNSLVDNQLTDHRSGFQTAWDDILEKQGEQVKKELLKTKRSLEKWLYNELTINGQDS